MSSQQPSIIWPSTLEVEIDSLAQGGAGVGRWAARPVFVAGALPGERVRARIVERSATWARATLLEILSAPAPERSSAACGLYGQCGGCDWQHLQIDTQRQAKSTILADQLTHMGRIANLTVLPTVGAAAWHYRSTARFHIAGQQIGFYSAGGRTIVPLERCPLLDDRLNATLQAVQPLLPLAGLREITLRLSTTTGKLHALLAGQGHPAWSSLAQRWRAAVPALSGVSSVARHGWRMLAGSPYLEEELAGVRLRISPTSFFQANVAQAQAVLSELTQRLELTPDSRLLDAFCGVGTFVLPLARQVGHAWGIEEHPAAVADAQASATASGISNLTLIAGTVESQLAQISGPLDAAILDPPRRGCASSAIAALLALRPTQIAYVSCHPGTLARDVARLTQAGYTVQSAQPFDFFPQTAHIESLIVLRRTAGD